MAVSTITLTSTNGDSVVVSAPNDDYLADDIVLDTDPKGMYDVGFTTRTQSGAFEIGGRIAGEQVPIREPILPFWLTKASRPRFQRLWGTPYNFQKVTCTWDGPSGPRSLTLKLSKEIEYTTDEGFDADLNDVYHAVVSALAVNPMYESPATTASWVNPGNFTVFISSKSGAYTLSYVDANGTQTTSSLPVGSSITSIQTALEGLSNLGAGNVTVTGDPAQFTVQTPITCPGNLTVDGGGLAPIAFSITIGTLNFTISVGGETTTPISFLASASTIQQALEQLSTVGTDGVTVAGTFFGHVLQFASGPLSNVIVALFTGQAFAAYDAARVVANPNTGWFDVWNPTDQALWLEWVFDPAQQWQFPDFSFGQERKWGRDPGADAARMIVTPELTQILSVMSDPYMDTYVNADLSNAAGLFNGVEPVYMVPPYTASEDDPVMMPVICQGPCGATATLLQHRFWSAESGLELT
ncbi:hypothetical protein HMPREF0591_4805 [Mycobacterium parascrofulaceum ATCC BAA-614]|uniref:Uncharacterized protein n=1 Tax=Mycobacterium parascrofulaceum ATCC BAA-614 TaxID=525368 RepID=D5PF61_9MYCO|nr:hypothetical protein [Mycobacterium parascrofulaceum]EFG75242.1 hypothetical protein HMPREF0591_4805 [Mycobacterium parascrofulaceum ATCC BAA-614]